MLARVSANCSFEKWVVEFCIFCNKRSADCGLILPQIWTDLKSGTVGNACSFPEILKDTISEELFYLNMQSICIYV